MTKKSENRPRNVEKTNTTTTMTNHDRNTSKMSKTTEIQT